MRAPSPLCLRVTLLLALCLVAGPAVMAQAATFTVTVETKTSDHPYNGQGWPEGYVIDGDQGAELTLVRGETYEFQMDGVSAIHPFYISTSESGASAGVYNDGVTGNFATGNETLTFAVPLDAPDPLWYQCASHTFMGYRLNVTDSPTDTEDEAQPVALALAPPYPNPFDEQTTLLLELDRTREVTVEVFDVGGRRVRTLHGGILADGYAHPIVFKANGLADGRYVVRVTAGEDVAERHVTLVR